MSSIDFDNDDFNIDDDVVIIDDDDNDDIIDEDEKLEAPGDIDDVDEDEFEVEVENDDDDEEEDIDIDVLDIEEKKEDEKSETKNITVPFITKYEYPKIISTRAQQIASGSPIFIDIDDIELKKKKPMEIAELELKQGKLNNIKIKRILPNGKIEMRKLSELKFYSFY